MTSHFVLSACFLDPTFHGRRDGGRPEWPPSPIRLFQSLVAAASARRRTDVSAQAFQWLERQESPLIVAPSSATTSGYRLSVPNNAMDIVAKAWCRGNYSNVGDANPSKHKTMKTVRPTRMLDDDTVHYIWPLSDPVAKDVRGHVEELSVVARSVASLGWGVDLVVGNGALLSGEQINALPGEQWIPARGSNGGGLRVPAPGTFDDLIRRHKSFLSRIGNQGFTPTPPLSVYETRYYRRETDPQPRPSAAFSLLKLDAGGYRPFDAASRALTVAGMMRHATRLAAQRAGWDENKTNSLVLGHGQDRSGDEQVETGSRRFAYFPVPTIEDRGESRASVVGSIRRVILAELGDSCENDIAWARRALSGQDLIDKGSGKPVALLSLIPKSDRVIRHYLRQGSSWVTVTPVVLPGFDDPRHYRRRIKRGTSSEEQKRLLCILNNRIDTLLRKAIRQAGFHEKLASHAEIEWQRSGFLPGVELADRYGVPDHLKHFPRLHVRLRWRDANGRQLRIPGPICIGGGRFFGIGLFVAEEMEKSC